MDVEAWVKGGDIVVGRLPTRGRDGGPEHRSVTARSRVQTHPPRSARMYDPNTRSPHPALRRSATSIPSAKPQRLPVVGEHVIALHGEGEGQGGRNVPYRLPRIPGSKGDVRSSRDAYMEFSRHGFISASPDELITARSLQGGAGGSARILASAQVAAELRRHQQYSGGQYPGDQYPTGRYPTGSYYHSQFPQFRQATITPVPRIQPQHYAGSLGDPAFFRSMMTDRPGTVSDGGYTPGAPHAPTPVTHTQPLSPRSHPPPAPPTTQQHAPHPPPPRSPRSARSSKSIHWALTPYKKAGYDKKGIKSAQGPYSRVFTRTCRAPNNWLKMKLGRHKSAPTPAPT